MKTLSKEQVLRLHNALLETFGGTAGVRDDGLLESDTGSPQGRNTQSTNRRFVRGVYFALKRRGLWRTVIPLFVHHWDLVNSCPD